MTVVEKGPGCSAALFTPIRLDPAISQSGMELWVLACGLSPGIGEKGAGMGVGGEAPSVHIRGSFLTWSAPPCRAGYSGMEAQEKWGRGTTPQIVWISGYFLCCREKVLGFQGQI